MAGDRSYGIDIILRLKDEASAQIEEFKKSLNGIGQETEGLQKAAEQTTVSLTHGFGEAKKSTEGLRGASEQASKSLGQGFKDVNAALRTVRRNLLVVAIAVAAVAATTQEWAKHNEQTRDALNSLGASVKEAAALIGSLLAPAIIVLAAVTKEALGVMVNIFKTVHSSLVALVQGFTYGIVFMKEFTNQVMHGTGVMAAYRQAILEATKSSAEMEEKMGNIFQENIPYAEAARVALDNYSQAQQNLDLLFIAGQISSREYFNGIVSGQSRIIEQNTLIAEQSHAYLALLSEISNADLMNFQASIQGKMDFFNTYKQMYMQGHADMYAFGNMLANEFHANMSGALSSIILGEAKARDAFKAFGEAMVKAIVDYMVQQAVAFAISKVMQGIILATGITLANSLAAAWAPAAALVSLATLGGNAVPAQAGMVATTATAYALAAPKAMALGGEGTVTKPTLFLAGEAGPERYNFTPLWKDRSGGNTQQVINNFDIKISNPVVRSETDIDALVEEMSRKLALEVERMHG